MPKKVDKKMRNLMFKLWRDGRTVSEIADLTGVSKPTVRTYQRTDNWDVHSEGFVERENSIAAGAESQIDRVIEAAINVFTHGLVGYAEKICECGKVVQVPVPRVRIKPADFERFVRMLTVIRMNRDRKPRERLDPDLVLPVKHAVESEDT